MRIILVTGANGGLGQAITRTFLNDGDFVWLGVHSRRDDAEKLEQEFLGRCACVALDVTQPDSWKSAVAEIQAKHQRLDVLVNNAGKHRDALLATMPPSAWQEILSTNLDAVFHGCQVAPQDPSALYLCISAGLSAGRTSRQNVKKRRVIS